jgi:hypothetical protein
VNVQSATGGGVTGVGVLVAVGGTGVGVLVAVGGTGVGVLVGVTGVGVLVGVTGVAVGVAVADLQAIVTLMMAVLGRVGSTGQRSEARTSSLTSQPLKSPMSKHCTSRSRWRDTGWPTSGRSTSKLTLLMS